MSIYSLSQGISRGEKKLHRIMRKIDDLRESGDERRCMQELPKIKIALRKVGCKRYMTSPYVKLMARSILKEIDQRGLSGLSARSVDETIVVKHDFGDTVGKCNVARAGFRGKATI